MRTRWWIAIEVVALLGLGGVLAALVVVTDDDPVAARTVTVATTVVVTRTTPAPPAPPPRRTPRARPALAPSAVETAAAMYRLRARDPSRAARRYDHPVARRYGCAPAAAARAYARMRWTPFRVVASRRVDWTLPSLGLRFRDARELTVRRPGGTTTFHMARHAGRWRAFPRCR